MYLKTPQHRPILPKSASAALQSLAFHKGVRRSCALQLHLFGEMSGILEFSDTPLTPEHAAVPVGQGLPDGGLPPVGQGQPGPRGHLHFARG